MTTYEYKVTPAPVPAGRAARRAAQLAEQLEAELNQHAKDDWQFVRLDVLSVETKRWFRRAKSELQSVVVFRREKSEPLPQLVLRRADAERAAQADGMTKPPVEPERAAEPPRIENAVRGFGRGTGMAANRVVTKERAPLVAARRG